MAPHLKKLTFERRAAYKAAHLTKDGAQYSDENPITSGYSPMPWAPAYDALSTAIRPLLQTAAPAVPLSAWQDHDLHAKPWAHLFINSQYPYRNIKPSDWAALSPMIISGFLYEFFLAGQYRPAIIKGPGGEMRHILVEALPDDLTAAITYTFEDDGIKSFVWWDALRAPRVARESDDVYRKRAEIAKVDISLSGELEKIVKMIAKSNIAVLPSSRYSDDDPPYIAREIDLATSALVKVSGSHTIVAHINNN